MSRGGQKRKLAKTGLLRLPPAEDEESVNIALVLLLQNLSDLVAQVDLEWVPNRHHFSVIFGTVMNTITDGILRSRKDGQGIFCLLEAKKMMRRDNDVNVKMQETAEIVGWIRSSPDKLETFRGRRFVISQNRHQIFIIAATYDDEYVRYLEGASSGPKSFLEEQSYGPYDTADLSDLKMFARAVVVITMAANATI
ncbi:uncharacterized protein TRUGW13939_01177 [Talaromyces rugulosus]|uniref:Fungal-type protein kinase domain-containing protein n=1 Tax=Talaromyces rugulosus TaxID=121627 RepID=A0A7H8QJH4_TALRU|nr:uncharacterized protein TRUGW13939_01177 [Talaromyces rugulosus]QKX54094.1 hypothetical protein TRUGW13939_01177 [Talaromyces rugulosus]